jgi:hypothetical protein
MHLNFIVLFGVLGVIFGFTWFLPRHQAAAAGAARWRPGRVGVPRALARVFATSATAVTAGYALGAVMLSLGAQIARELIGSHNALASGAPIAVFAVAVAGMALVAKRLESDVAIVSGGLLSALGMMLLALSASRHDLALYVAAAASAGAGYSLQFLGGLTLINARAPETDRAGALSAVYLVGYLAMGAIALGLGSVATAWGLGRAVELGAPAMAALALAAALLAAGRAGRSSLGVFLRGALRRE